MAIGPQGSGGYTGGNLPGAADALLRAGQGFNFGAFQQALQNMVIAINTLNETMKGLFPQATASLSTSATAGAADPLPGDPEVYISVFVNGTEYKIPGFLP